MNLFQALQQDFEDLSDFNRVVRVILRLLVAAVLGGLLGYERQSAGKPAGLRTYMLVTVGSALFILVPELDGMAPADLSRIIQGIVAGIGFLGGGAILKLESDKEIQGLTTAAGIWLAAAVGIAVGLGKLGTAMAATVLALLILGLLVRLESNISRQT